MKTLDFASFGFLVAVCVAVPAMAEGDKVGETQQCIRLRDIDQTPAIDSKTILVKMKGRGQYKRIDLASPCPGLTFSGFAHTTSIDQLCTSDPLHVIEPVGATCMIDKIVTIDEAEAKALQASKNKK